MATCMPLAYPPESVLWYTFICERLYDKEILHGYDSRPNGSSLLG